MGTSQMHFTRYGFGCFTYMNFLSELSPEYSASARVWIGQGDNVRKGHIIPCNNKMGNGVRGFPPFMGWYGGGGGEMRGLEGREKAFGVFLRGNTWCIVFPYM